MEWFHHRCRYALLILLLPCMVGADASWVAVVDLNDDGLDDLAIITENAVQFALAAGDGTFESGRRVAIDPGRPVDLIVTEMDGEDPLDVIVGYEDLGGFLLNTGPGSTLRAYGQGVELQMIAAGESDGDRLLLGAFGSPQGGVLFRYDSDAGSVIQEQVLSFEEDHVLDFAFVDFDGDSSDELVVLFESHASVYHYSSRDGLTLKNDVSLDSGVGKVSDTKAALVIVMMTLRVQSVLTLTFLTDTRIESQLVSAGRGFSLVLHAAEGGSDESISRLRQTSVNPGTDFSHERLDYLDITAGHVSGRDFILLAGFDSGPFVESYDPSTGTSQSVTIDDWAEYDDPNGIDLSGVADLIDPSNVELVFGRFSSSGSGVVFVVELETGVFVASFVPTDSSGVVSGAITSVPVTATSETRDNSSVVIHDASNPELVFWSADVSGWTTGAALSGSSLVVQREADSGSGLSPASSVTIPNVRHSIWPSDVEIVYNQPSDEQSIFHLTQPLPTTVLRTVVSPRGGSYESTVQIALESREGAMIFYRLDGGAWEEYDAATSMIYFHRDGTLEAYATYGSVVGALLKAEYELNQAYDRDSDFDGVPDFVEDELGLNPLDFDTDTDDDGWRDLLELVRGSDPRNDADHPVDSDASTESELADGIYGDGWSDYDELIRQTDVDDPDSYPVVTGVEIPEAVIPVAVSESSLNSPAGVAGSRIRSRLLTGGTTASATLTGDASVRSAVDRPLVVGVIDADDPEIILLGYAARTAVDTTVDGDESTTAEEWIRAYTLELESALFEERSTITLDAESTAVVLAMANYIESAIPLDAPSIIWSGSGTPSQMQIDLLEQSLDLDEAADVFAAGIVETGLPDLVRAYIDYAEDNDITGTIVEQIAWILHGWDAPDASDVSRSSAKMVQGASTKTTAIDLDAIRDAVDDLSDEIPGREVTLTGTLFWADEGYPALEIDSVRYGLDGEGVPLPLGSEVIVRGRTATPSPFTDVFWVRLNGLEIVSTVPLSNDTDSDGNGIADEWEDFYFPATPVDPSVDTDEDGYTNLQEFQGFSDPTDSLSLPSADTSVESWMIHG